MPARPVCMPDRFISVLNRLSMSSSISVVHEPARVPCYIQFWVVLNDNGSVY